MPPSLAGTVTPNVRHGGGSHPGVPMPTDPGTEDRRPVILTGDRTTGPLHLGHYVGSLKNRVTLQMTHQQYLLLADTQALTDNAHNPGRLRDNILEIATDYLAVGIDPNHTTICLQ